MNAAQIKKYSGRVRRRRLFRRLILAVLLLAAVLLLIDHNFKPLVLSLAEARSAAMASQVLNAALGQALGNGIGYDDLMNVRMDENGQVALLSANTVQMNMLADKAGDAALRMLESMSSEQVGVPLGAALGITLLAGSGPIIPVSIVPIGSVSTDFETEFEACGINQTRHKISLEATASVRIVLPSGARTVSVQASALMAESILIGEVPQSYIQVPETGDALNFLA